MSRGARATHRRRGDRHTMSRARASCARATALVDARTVRARDRARPRATGGAVTRRTRSWEIRETPGRESATGGTTTMDSHDDAVEREFARGLERVVRCDDGRGLTTP